VDNASTVVKTLLGGAAAVYFGKVALGWLSEQANIGMCLCPAPGALFDEHPVNGADDLDFLRRSWNEDDTIRLNAFLFTPQEDQLDYAGLIFQLSPKTIPSGATLPEAELDEAALAEEDLGREFPAVLPRHHPLHAFEHSRDLAAVVFELLCAIMDVDLGSFADVFVVCAFVCVLEAPPATHVVNQNFAEIGLAALDVPDQLLQRFAALDVQSTPILIRVCAHYDPVPHFGPLMYDGMLVLGRILLMLGRHANVLCRADRVANVLQRSVYALRIHTSPVIWRTPKLAEKIGLPRYRRSDPATPAVRTSGADWTDTPGTWASLRYTVFRLCSPKGCSFHKSVAWFLCVNASITMISAEAKMFFAGAPPWQISQTSAAECFKSKATLFFMLSSRRCSRLRTSRFWESHLDELARRL